MIFDTGVLIWFERGNEKAVELLDQNKERRISVQTYMELLQSAPSKKHHRLIKDFLKDHHFIILPLTENIGHRAAIYIEEYSLKDGIRAGDALIAATAVETNFPLVTANKKHFNQIKELQLRVFTP